MRKRALSADMNDGTQIILRYRNIGIGYGLTPDTEYFYGPGGNNRGSNQQWSEASRRLVFLPALRRWWRRITPAWVEETSATLHGSVTFDGTEPCSTALYMVRTGCLYFSNPWAGECYSGQEFSFDVSGLAKGTKYYFRASSKTASAVLKVRKTIFYQADPPYNPGTMVSKLTHTGNP